MALTGLLRKNLQFVLFGGKGGVGKTTMAAAAAMQFAAYYPKKKILLFTTDPAPSLADSLGQKLANKPIQVAGFTNLWALEINAQEELQDFKKQYGDDILDILQEGTYLAAEETKTLFSLDIPGIDEVMGLKKIIDFMDSTPEQHSAQGNVRESPEHYDLFILDTAPTGHTLRLLTLPELLDDWIKFLAQLRWKYHAMIEQFSRGKEKRIEKADEFLLGMKKTVKKVQALLRDPEKTSFVVVTIPEAMGVEETKDLAQNLNHFHVPMQHIIINTVVPAFAKSSAGNSRELRFLQKRRAVQQRYIHELQESFPNYTMTEVELEADEIQGKEKLILLGKKLFT